MAGAGYKLFNTGDVLTAQQVNEYLMQQTVMVFASSAARTTALSGVLAEGMISYLQDTNTLAKYDGSSWVTIDLPSQTGNSGKYLTTNGTTPSWATVSAGITWTQRLSPTGVAFTAVAFNGSSTYVATGDSGQLYSSTDGGVTWTSRTSGFGANNISWVSYGNGLFVAVGANGTITTSSDGTTWTARTSGMSTNQINFVIYDNSIWVAVGAGGGGTNTGGITYSTDGITWTRKSQTLTGGSVYYMAAWNGTNWIVATDFSTTNYIYATTPSGTWTTAATGVSADVSGVFYDGTRTIVYHTSGSNWKYTTGATLASLTDYNSTNAGGGTTGTKKTYYYYSGNMYTNTSSYLTNWSTTPNAANYPSSYSGFTFSPAVTLSASGGLTGNQGGTWVGAAGRIITSNIGAIFTSF